VCYKKGTQDMLTLKVLKHQLLSSAALTPKKKNVKGEGLILGDWHVDYHVHLRVPCKGTLINPVSNQT